MSKLKISFFGGCKETTGSNYLLEHFLGSSVGESQDKSGSKILVDCGLFQGSRFSEEKNYDVFPYDASSVDALFVTHAHLDHVGRIPKLIKEGFKGPIFSTPGTRDLAQLMLVDSLGIMEKEVKRHRKAEMMYLEGDVQKAMAQWQGVEYGQSTKIGGYDVILKDAGHILGSSIVDIKIGNKKIVFTGDLGNSPNPILRDPEKIIDADVLLIESTYGDRLHGDLKEADLKLERIIEDTIHVGGVLMIPAFSLERTQKLLFKINDLIEHGRIPKVPIFLDSPLAIRATAVYKKYKKYYNQTAKDIILSGDALFDFPGLKLTLDRNDSMAINNVPAPKIIMAGSGMCSGGRIIHHLRRYLSDRKNMLLLIGYQAKGSLGRQLQEGASEVSIWGEPVLASARIETIRGYSAHPDMDKLFEIVEGTSSSLKKLFVVQGERKSSLFFVQRVRDYLGLNAVAPEIGDTYEIEV